jgi:Phage tail assembly chaperone protein, TAC
MHEFKIGEHTYRANKLNARQQFHVGRRIAPLIGQMFAVGPVISGIAAARRATEEEGGENLDDALDTARATEAMLVPFTKALAGLSDADCDYVLDRCLGVVQRLSGANGAGAWGDVFNARANRIQYEDIDLMQMMQITAEVLMDNLGGFFATPLPGMPNLGSPAQRSSTASNLPS